MIRHQLFTRFSILTLLLLSVVLPSWSQDNRPATEKALAYLQQNFAQLGLSQQDVSDTRIVRSYSTKHNGLKHVWIQQQYHGIPVYNALIGIHQTTDGRMIQLGHNFVSNLQQKINTGLPSLSAGQALEVAMKQLGFSGFKTPSVYQKKNERNWEFEGGAISKSRIPVSACYQVMKNGSVHLAWTMVVDQANTSDYWNIRIDAITGELLEKDNQTKHCAPDVAHAASMNPVCIDEHRTITPSPISLKPESGLTLVDEKYNVFPLPIESPVFGNRSVLTNPADPIASPYGWLDTNRVAGAEFTYTRGNNVWAFDDSPNDNTPDPTESADAGSSLNFDFSLNPDAEPYDNSLAAITNLFYMNNMMHDITYRFGFDEEAGNYQYNLYGAENGVGGDPVYANALDGSGTNNADFTFTPDGVPGRIQMFPWNQQAGQIVKVLEPGIVAGTYFGGKADWGGDITDVPLTANTVFFNDDIEPTLGCETPLNNLAGKIVMVDRGDCEFGFKAYNAEQFGAVACIICDHESPPISGGLGAGVYGSQVTIPTLYMKKKDCDLLRQYSGAGGLKMSLVLPPAGTGPEQLDGDFDNGIIAHEYGHGISFRLTTDSEGNNCLGNAEQMGEGWSDFFAMALTVKPGDSGTTKRGLANYVIRQPVEEGTLRRYFYSTDMSVNPLTYNDLQLNPEEHALGEIWTTMTWDLFWALVEKYGYDADLTNHNSGNARAMQLIIDGLKLQKCRAGFVDGRDGIMMADKLNYNGEDTCLISSVFARRGLGYKADQGDSEDATDGTANFDPIPTCIKALKIEKSTTTPTIEAGGVATFVLTVINHKDEDALNVQVTDDLPATMTLVGASNGGTFSNGQIHWNLGTVTKGQVITLTYQAKSADNYGSTSQYLDVMDTDFDWVSLSINSQNIEVFELQDTAVVSGASAWFGRASTLDRTDFSLESVQEFHIIGQNPVLRFWNRYNTERGVDAGFVEFSDQGVANPVWKRVTPSETVRNGYSGRIQYGAGSAYSFANHYGFFGNSAGWKQSYIDLRGFKNKNIKIRYRFGTNDDSGPTGGGWAIDETELLDLTFYDTKACVSSSNGDFACDTIGERGVVVNPAVVATHEPTTAAPEIFLNPNPASEFVYLRVSVPIDEPTAVTLTGTDGKTVLSKQISHLAAGQAIGLDIDGIPAGVYFVQVQNTQMKSTGKIIIK